MKPVSERTLKWCEYCQLDADLDDDPNHFQANGKCASYAHEKDWGHIQPQAMWTVREAPTLKCNECGLPLSNGTRIIESPEWGIVMCSWDCISERNDRYNRGADAQIKHDKIHHSAAYERNWPDKNRGR